MCIRDSLNTTSFIYNDALQLTQNSVNAGESFSVLNNLGNQSSKNTRGNRNKGADYVSDDDVPLSRLAVSRKINMLLQPRAETSQSNKRKPIGPQKNFSEWFVAKGGVFGNVESSMDKSKPYKAVHNYMNFESFVNQTRGLRDRTRSAGKERARRVTSSIQKKRNDTSMGFSNMQVVLNTTSENVEEPANRTTSIEMMNQSITEGLTGSKPKFMVKRGKLFINN
eukprot:TRINITY_DN9280_c0_g1_i5.p1 TRINITY_DN9280_c0_g1~~TRINITY_DN9280_c0_g1_i5.p1  ORF type:complete len:243 (+),score=38.96 TRINITY_DN9280_c0_g1_i5:60-731(+)